MIQLMTTGAKPETRTPRVSGEDGDALDRVETEMAVLTRALERLHRRSEIYRDLDRAGYLMARTLDATGPVSINGLAATLGLDATTVTRQVAAMEATRLVRRRADPDDARVSLISLSPLGRRRMLTVQSARKERIGTLLRSWSDGDRQELGRLLTRFNDELSRDMVDDGTTGRPTR